MVSNPYDSPIAVSRALFDFVRKENYSTIDSYFQPCIVTSLDHLVQKILLLTD